MIAVLMGQEGERHLLTPRRPRVSEDAVTRRLAREYLDAESLDTLPDWLAQRAQFLPLLGMGRSLLRAVVGMDPSHRQAYLAELPDELLDDPREREQWRRLQTRYRETAREMVVFWQRQRER